MSQPENRFLVVLIVDQPALRGIEEHGRIPSRAKSGNKLIPAIAEQLDIFFLPQIRRTGCHKLNHLLRWVQGDKKDGRLLE